MALLKLNHSTPSSPLLKPHIIIKHPFSTSPSHISFPNPRHLPTLQLHNPFITKCTSTTLPQTETQTLIPKPGPTKRPVCPNCSKPTRICLCNRLKTPPLNNSVHVTILQHSLETKHHLNSTRIARIGLRNVDVVTVSDVKYRARFVIRLLDETRHVFDEMLDRESKGFVVDIDRNDRLIRPFNSVDITCDELMKSGIGVDDMRKGFVVKKLMKKPLEGSEGFEEIEEFEISVPMGSVLLFPSEGAVGVEDVDFELKNLIVLDGTWTKARRMYYENPWLRYLPHVRLDVDKLSLYSEVRPQPRVGYLSTIESVVYAMKGVGEDSEGLDGLLDVFESMVGDQRRCMNERLSKAASECDHRLSFTSI